MAGLLVVLSIIGLWCLFGFIIGKIAAGKGYDFPAFFIYGFLLFPVALIHALVLRDIRHVDRALTVDQARKCPSCAEMVRAEATVCRFCQTALPPLPRTAAEAMAAHNATDAARATFKSESAARVAATADSEMRARLS